MILEIRQQIAKCVIYLYSAKKDILYSKTNLLGSISFIFEEITRSPKKGLLLKVLLKRNSIYISDFGVNCFVPNHVTKTYISKYIEEKKLILLIEFIIFFFRSFQSSLQPQRT